VDNYVTVEETGKLGIFGINKIAQIDSLWFRLQWIQSLWIPELVFIDCWMIAIHHMIIQILHVAWKIEAFLFIFTYIIYSR